MSLDGCTAGRHESLALMSDRLSRAVTPDESRGLLDTSVVIDIDVIYSALLPDETVISAITLAELAAGPMPPTTRTSGAAGRTICIGRPRAGIHCRLMWRPRGRTGASTPR